MRCDRSPTAIWRGNDATAYDPARKLAFASNGDGTLSVFDGEAPFKVRQTLPTMARARTVALDQATHVLYTASAEPGSAGATTGNARVPMKAGTFTLLTVAP
jgi:hypothetical protein